MEPPGAPEPDEEVNEDELPYREKSIRTRHLRDTFSKLTIASLARQEYFYTKE
jgi:hypothetical protein